MGGTYYLNNDDSVYGSVWVNGKRIDSYIECGMPHVVEDANSLISDKERNDAFTILHNALAQGYLTLEEFDERAKLCDEARVGNDIVKVLAKLPISKLENNNAVENKVSAKRQFYFTVLSNIAFLAIGVLIGYMLQ